MASKLGGGGAALEKAGLVGNSFLLALEAISCSVLKTHALGSCVREGGKEIEHFRKQGGIKMLCYVAEGLKKLT